MSKLILNCINHPNLDFLKDKFEDYCIIILEKGTYSLGQTLVLEKEGTRIMGATGIAEDVHLIQESNQDGIVIRGKNIALHGISVHVKTGENICLVNQSSHWTDVQNCTFYGSDQYFAVYYVGPEHLLAGQETIVAYQNGALDSNNIFDNNIIYATWTGDSVSFSLQKNGSFRNNLVRGGKVAIYMCKTCQVTNNYVTDSTTNGIFVSLPSVDLMINENFVSRCVQSGISIRKQLEHGDYNDLVNNITLKGNIILDTQFHGMEINDCHQVVVSGNEVKVVKEDGIYLLHSSDAMVNNNVIINARTGIVMDITSGPGQVKNNQIYSIEPSPCNHALVFDQVSDYLVENNQFVGSFDSIHLKESLSQNEYRDNASKKIRINEILLKM